ncbi:DnaJ-domain-containing protein [Tilletiaria anomala UBC 951]|uniref:DnaJ-domain-containing protein n=1 Tax=Tilletiaria anomala (strain ATCC 24038 / CBS 436.72 / UBC 951) TaxID=1037660 RepID=A0A066VQA0_TILAU|nr:DnaJ-domain-containing protein [Tilletiaria anomala UBC 951]KDN43661.1 DnaJ-domain-containing protein [Tilletiaria anomala UBC 951]
MLFRWSWVLLMLLAACTALASNWSKEDYEIFELQAALQKGEGQNATFYSLLGIDRRATAAEIKKAYRKKSMELHPDRNQGHPEAHKRFERLGLVNKVLRDARRDRYDHFLTNGFPKWRGTGYFYERYRPGLGSVLLFIVLASAGVQRLIMGINYRRDAGRMENLCRSAKLAAYGPGSEAPAVKKSTSTSVGGGSAGRTLAGERKVRVPLQGFADLPPRPDANAPAADWEAHERTLKKAIASQLSSGSHAGRLVDIFVSSHGDGTKDGSGAISIEAVDPGSGDRLSLNVEDALPQPSFFATWPFALIRSFLGGASGAKNTGASSDGHPGNEAEGYDVGSGATASSVVTNGAAGTASKRKKRK